MRHKGLLPAILLAAIFIGMGGLFISAYAERKETLWVLNLLVKAMLPQEFSLMI